MQRLLEQIANDRLAPELGGHGMHPERERGYRAGWNAASEHIEIAVRRFEQQERMAVALRELAEAPAMDLSLKQALINLPSDAAPPPARQMGATPAAREVAGELEVPW